jgi:hypothetical protein
LDHLVEGAEHGFVPEHTLHPSVRGARWATTELTADPVNSIEGSGMPVKTMFETEDGSVTLINILTKLNQAMAGINKVKTVEELQVFIDNLNRVSADIKVAVTNG